MSAVNTAKPKRGQSREDGMVFFEKRWNTEVWVRPDELADRIAENNAYRRGLYAKNIELNRARKREKGRVDMVKRKTERKDYHLRNKFGLDMDDYRRMEVSQGFVCAICRKPESRKQRGKIVSLSVDHCHSTGAPRGLLCSACNTGIGLMKDNPTALRAVADYLEESANRYTFVHLIADFTQEQEAVAQ